VDSRCSSRRVDPVDPNSHFLEPLDIGTKALGIQRIRLLLHGSNSLQRNEDPLICSDEEKFCVDKIRLGSVSVTCVSPLRVDMSKEET
jgi:hypothetical protein